MNYNYMYGSDAFNDIIRLEKSCEHMEKDFEQIYKEEQVKLDSIANMYENLIQVIKRRQWNHRFLPYEERTEAIASMSYGGIRAFKNTIETIAAKSKAVDSALDKIRYYEQQGKDFLDAKARIFNVKLTLEKLLRQLQPRDRDLDDLLRAIHDELVHACATITDQKEKEEFVAFVRTCFERHLADCGALGKAEALIQTPEKITTAPVTPAKPTSVTDRVRKVVKEIGEKIKKPVNTR